MFSEYTLKYQLELPHTIQKQPDSSVVQGVLLNLKYSPSVESDYRFHCFVQKFNRNWSVLAYHAKMPAHNYLNQILQLASTFNADGFEMGPFRFLCLTRKPRDARPSLGCELF